ncbi:PPE family protein [Nocardia callitridis]|uniref:PPE domain-containing protein n=1 Tax=Nocardia callitridis TaxID=648753 RepID=A0ABP9KN89_9NOCA
MLYGAYPPEQNSARLMSGRGPVPMLGAAAAYASIADGLLAAAAASESDTRSMGVTYQGDSADKAQLAFHKHAGWLRDQGMIAMTVSQHAMVQAELYSAALAKMPSLLAIVANRATLAGLVLTNSMAQNSAAIAANEFAYDIMWATAAAVMYEYHAETAANTGSMPPPPPAPEITSPSLPGMGQGPGSGFDGGQHSGLPVLNRSGGGGAAVPKDTAGFGDTAGREGPGRASDPGGNPDAPVQPDQPPVDQPPVDLADNPASEALPDPAQMTDLPYGSEDFIDGTSSEMGYLGTSPQSSTLAGLNGGMGSSVAVGLLRGGPGAMPGGATGFRLPTNWSLGKPGGTAFGAPLNNNPSGASPARKAAPRGVIAPKTRRRRRDDEKSTKQVFVPGEPQEVPVLEKPPVIGVIEYTDDVEPSVERSESPLMNILGEPDRGEVKA